MNKIRNFSNFLHGSGTSSSAAAQLQDVTYLLNAAISSYYQHHPPPLLVSICRHMGCNFVFLPLSVVTMFLLRLLLCRRRRRNARAISKFGGLCFPCDKDLRTHVVQIIIILLSYSSSRLGLNRHPATIHSDS